MFISAPWDVLMERLAARKVRGGLSAADAAAFVAKSDAKNVKRILTNRLPCDYELLMDEAGKYHYEP
jgi:pantothenate kinase